MQIVVADENQVAAKALAASHQRVTSAAAGDLLNLDLDALDVCVPSRFHRDWIVAGLERGLNVFCEKPLCLDYCDALDIRDAALSAQRNVVVGYLYQHLRADDYLYNAYQTGFTPATLLPSNLQSPNYSVNVVYAAYRYTFK